MRYLSLIFGILLIFSGLPALAQTSYEDSHRDFQCVIPSGWNRISNTKGTVLLLDGPGNGKMAVWALPLEELNSKVQNFESRLKKMGAKKDYEQDMNIHQVPVHLNAWEGKGFHMLFASYTAGQRGFLVLAEAPPKFGSFRFGTTGSVHQVLSHPATGYHRFAGPSGR